MTTKKFCVQAAFVAEDVTSIIKESIDAVLQNQPYSHLKVRLISTSDEAGAVYARS